MKKISLVLTCAVLIAALFAGCSPSENNAPDESPVSILPTPYGPDREPDLSDIELVQFDPIAPGERTATINTTEGIIQIRLFPDRAPAAVENFEALAREGFFNGKTFHRIARGVMIQTGALYHSGEGGVSIFRDENGNPKPLDTEWHPDLWHFRGAVSLVSHGEGGRHLSQFMIVQNAELSQEILDGMADAGFPPRAIERYASVGGAPHLDGNQTIFGHVILGMDVVDAIAEVQVVEQRPVEDVLILSVTIS